MKARQVCLKNWSWKSTHTKKRRDAFTWQRVKRKSFINMIKVRVEMHKVEEKREKMKG